jgi:ammonia channel protein AmtB
MNINAGDTAWVMLSAALVFFMLPGLALFYGGLVRTKNVVATMVQCLVALGVISVLWVAVGYTLAISKPSTDQNSWSRKINSRRGSRRATDHTPGADSQRRSFPPTQGAIAPLPEIVSRAVPRRPALS